MKALAAVAAVLALTPAAAGAQTPGPQGALEASCQAGGHSADTCACYGGFIAENFSDTEMAAAVAIFTSPDLADQFSEAPQSLDEMMMAMAALTEAVEDIGVSEFEMLGLVARVLDLSGAAMNRCETDQ